MNLLRIDKHKVQVFMSRKRIETFEELAAEAGEISERTLYNYLNSYTFNTKFLYVLARTLGCEPMDLITLDPEEYANTQRLAPGSVTEHRNRVLECAA